MTDFITFARAYGVDIDPVKLYPSDRIKRCGTVDKPRSTNAAFFWDGQRGWVFDWSGEAKTIWYEDPNAKPWTPEEKSAWAQKRSAAASEQEKKYAEVAARAEQTLKKAQSITHSYLEMKGFKEEKGLVLEEKLLIHLFHSYLY